MEKYDEIMNKIKVDEGMKQRILSYVEQLDLQTQKAAASPFAVSEGKKFPFQIGKDNH